MAVATPRVWPEKLDPDAIREIRAMKERAEEITERKGIGDRELKRGRGGIRDIEFAVQLLQLVHGRDDATVRSPTTLDALARARRRRLRRTRRRRPTRSRVPVPPHGRAPPAALRRAADPHDPVRRPRAGAPRTRARLPRRPGAHRAGTLRDRTPPAPARGAQRSTNGCSSRRCSRRSPAPARCRPEAAEERLAAFGFTDVERTRAAVARAHRRPHPPLARDAAAPPGDPRLAVGDPGSRPRPAPAPAPGRGARPVRRRSRSPSATIRVPPSAPVASSDRAGCSATPAPPSGVRRRARRRRRPGRRGDPRRSRRRRVRHPRVARRPGATA